MAIEIAIDAEADGKEFKSTIRYEGSRDDILRALRFIDENAGKAELTPREFVESTLFHLPSTGFLADEGVRQLQMMAIVYAVLRLANDDPETTQVVDGQDIIASLTLRDTEMTVTIGSSSTSASKKTA